MTRPHPRDLGREGGVIGGVELLLAMGDIGRVRFAFQIG